MDQTRTDGTSAEELFRAISDSKILLNKIATDVDEIRNQVSHKGAVSVGDCTEVERELAAAKAQLATLKVQLGNFRHGAHTAQECTHVLRQLTRSRSVRFVSLFAKRLRSALVQAKALTE